MIFARRHLILASVACSVALLTAGVVASSLGSSRPRSRPAAQDATGETAGLSPQRPSTWTALPPLTALPTETPVQQQYDAALASGLAASASLQAAQAAQVPAPGFSSAWPTLSVANTPEQWTSTFTSELLDIDFARQSRAGLGAWLSAEEAPELLPGVPPGVAVKVLYLSLLESAAVGEAASPIPDTVAWQADARAGVRWRVSDLLIQADPQFSQIVASGWQPIDQRFAVEDVTGALTINRSRAAATTTKRFSMAVYVGSAHWHQGYGTVLVNDWKET